MNWEMKSKFTNVVKKTINGVNYFANGQADAADHITIS